MNYEAYTPYVAVALIAALVAGGAAYTYADNTDTVNSLEADLDEANEKIEALEADIADYQSTISDLEADVSDYEDKVADLEAQLAAVPEYVPVVEAEYSEVITVYERSEGDEYESEFTVTSNVGDEDATYTAEFEYEYDVSDSAFSNATYKFYDEDEPSVGEREVYKEETVSGNSTDTFTVELEKGVYDVEVEHNFNSSELQELDEDEDFATADAYYTFDTTEDLYTLAE